MKIFRVTTSNDPKGYLVKAKSYGAARKHAIEKLNVKAVLASQEDLMDAGARGERAEVAGEAQGREEEETA